MKSKDAIIAELRELGETQARQINAQAKQIDALTAEVANLKLKLAKATKNSSNPPSSDITKPKKAARQAGAARKRKAGAQPSHTRNLRQPLPPERVSETIDDELDPAEIDRLGLTPTDQFDCIQHIELPDTPLFVTEHRFRWYQSADVSIYYPHALEIDGKLIFGPRLLAMVGWMKSGTHNRYTTIEQYFDVVLQAAVSRVSGEGLHGHRVGFSGRCLRGSQSSCRAGTL